jgi:hypothetical protein
VAFNETLPGQDAGKYMQVNQFTGVRIQTVIVRYTGILRSVYGDGRFESIFNQDGLNLGKTLAIYQEIYVTIAAQGLLKIEIAFPVTVTYASAVQLFHQVS